MYMTYTWSQITITFWLFQKWVFCVLHACCTLFSDIQNLQIHQLLSILKQFLKDFKNNTQLLRNVLRATITAMFSDFASSWRLWFTGGYWPCAVKIVSHTVLAFSPSSLKVSVPPGKPDKFLKINKEVFRLLIPPHYTKMLRNPNGHYLSFVKAEWMQLLFSGCV